MTSLKFVKSLLARQVQERLTKQIAEALDGALQPHGVGVVRSPPLQQTTSLVLTECLISQRLKILYVSRQRTARLPRRAALKCLS